MGLLSAALGIVLALASGSSHGAGQSARPTMRADDPAALTPVTAIVGVRVFDGVGVVEGATVVIEGETIVDVGTDVVIPAGAEVIDGAGRTLLPGLIDAHVHVWEAAQLETALQFGVTTVLDMLTSAEVAAVIRAEQAGEVGRTRADLFSAGYAATAPGGHGTEYGIPVPTLSRPDEAAAFVAERVAEGSDFIKIIHDDGSMYGTQRIPTLDLATMRALIDAAHAHGRLAVVHPGGLSGARAALEAGADGLVHVWGDSLPPASFVERLRRDSMFVVPTLGVQSSVGGVAGGASLVDDARLAPWLGPEARANLERAFPVSPMSRASYAAASGATALLREAGVPVLVGSDAPNPGAWYGVSVHDELTRLVRDAGFTPREALRAATSVPAQSFGLDDRGRIAPGLRADLLLVEGNPVLDIAATRSIVAVWKRGRRLDRDAFRTRLEGRTADAAAALAPVPIPDGGLLLSDFEGAAPASALGQWVVTTDQLMGGRSSGSMAIESGATGGRALRVSGEIAPGMNSWSGVMLLPAAQPMQPVNLSGATGVALRVRAHDSFQLALFTRRGGRIPAVLVLESSEEWQAYEAAWRDFGEHDGSDVIGIAILGGPARGDYEMYIDDVRLTR